MSDRILSKEDIASVIMPLLQKYCALSKNVDVYEPCEINAGADFYNTISPRGCKSHEVYG